MLNSEKIFETER
jgi:hypothetical protein